MHLPTLIAQNVPCTKVQQMMGAVCHQQTPLSYTAETRKVIILAVLALDNIKACQSHSTTPKRTGITKPQQASSKTLAPRQTNRSKNKPNSLSLTHSQIVRRRNALLSSAGSDRKPRHRGRHRRRQAHRLECNFRCRWRMDEARLVARILGPGAINQGAVSWRIV